MHVQTWKGGILFERMDDVRHSAYGICAMLGDFGNMIMR